MIVAGFLLTFSPVQFRTSPISFQGNPMASNFTNPIVIDGQIGAAEWAHADHNITFTLTGVNTTVDSTGLHNVNGPNYMYIAEDMQKLYLALDLCSDQTWLPGNEWVGVWLNTAGQSFNSIPSWSSDLNTSGVESLIYSVQNNRTWDYLTNDLSGGWTAVGPGEIQVVNGTAEGDYSNLGSSSTGPYNITSTSINLEQKYRVDFALNMDNWFSYIEHPIISTISNFSITFKAHTNITSTNRVNFWYPNDTYNKDDLSRMKNTNTTTTEKTVFIPYSQANISANDVLRFSLEGNASAPFMMMIDELDFNFIYNNTVNRIAIYPYTQITVAYPFSTITSYQLAYGFGPSSTCAAPHRMFEIAIPKTELPGYNSTSNLGIIVGGYGTLSISGTNNWMFGYNTASSSYIPYYNSNYYNSYPMNVSAPVVNFTATIPNAIDPGLINFTFTGNAGDYPAAIQWSFGDSSANSSDNNPVHRYSQNGTYSVTATVADFEGDSSSLTKQITIAIPPSSSQPPQGAPSIPSDGTVLILVTGTCMVALAAILLKKRVACT